LRGPAAKLLLKLQDGIRSEAAAAVNRHAVMLERHRIRPGQDMMRRDECTGAVQKPDEPAAVHATGSRGAHDLRAAGIA